MKPIADHGQHEENTDWQSLFNEAATIGESGISPEEITVKDYIDLAEHAIVITLPLPDETIESLLLFLDEEWVLVINGNHKPSGSPTSHCPRVPHLPAAQPRTNKLHQ